MHVESFDELPILTKQLLRKSPEYRGAELAWYGMGFRVYPLAQRLFPDQALPFLKGTPLYQLCRMPVALLVHTELRSQEKSWRWLAYTQPVGALGHWDTPNWCIEDQRVTSLLYIGALFNIDPIVWWGDGTCNRVGDLDSEALGPLHIPAPPATSYYLVPKSVTQSPEQVFGLEGTISNERS